MGLGPSKTFAVSYHDIFDYPLKKEELSRWESGITTKNQVGITFKEGFYCIKGRGKIIKKRINRQVCSQEKIKIAKKAARVISKAQTVLMVGVTGALAMNNADKKSDIDLFIITKKNRLWLTRLVVYLSLLLNNFRVRKPKDRNQKDKLCLNMWIDEGALSWNEKDRNIYTAHEIAQIIPLINKNKFYQRFLWENKWIKDFWPKAVDIKRIKIKKQPKSYTDSYTDYLLDLLEVIVYKFQLLYMRKKRTRETTTSSVAIFHPIDWGRKVLKKI